MGIWVGRYAIVAGEVREHGPWLVERTTTRDDEELRLLVLADPVDERSGEFSAEVAEAVAELFTRESLSVTGGLLRALRQAHANLAEWNRRSLQEHQVSVGLTCVAVRAGEATIAQVGAGVVYIAGPEGLRRLSTDDEPAAQPIGGEEQVEPQFFSTPLEQCTLLLLTGSVDQVVGTNAIAEALTAGPERTLSELYRRTRGVRDMAAVLVTVVEGEVTEAPASDDWDEEAAVEGAEAPDAAAATSNAAPFAWASRASIEASTETGAESTDDLEAAATEESRSERPVLAPAREEPQPPPAVDSGAPSQVAPVLDGRRRFPALRRQTSSYSGSAARQPGSLSGGGPRIPSVLAGRAGSNRIRGYALAALAVLAAVAIAVCTLPSLLEEDRGAQLDDAVVAAQQHIAKAGETDDPAVTRSELQAALAEISRGRSISPSAPQLAALQTQVDQGLAQLDAVVDLGASGLARVMAFDGVVTAPFTPAAVVSGGDALWLVDSEQGRVFQVAPTGQGDPAEVYRVDATYGDVVARAPGSIAWDAQGARLVVLDSDRNLFAFTPGSEPSPLPVRGIHDLESAAAIASYNGNLYVLDPAGGEIWRYLPGGDGFDSERTNTLGGIDIGDARALAVDGEFYLLGAAGVRHFREDRELPPLLKGIDRPLSSPAGLVVDGGRKLTYVADRGGRRIVVSDAEGNYVKQYRHPQFFDLRGIALSADGNTVYALTGDGIYSFAPKF
jgi:hypothetical protein